MRLKKIISVILLTICVFSFDSVLSINSTKVDSLKQELKKTASDTSKAKLFLGIAQIYHRNLGNLDSAIYFAELADHTIKNREPSGPLFGVKYSTGFFYQEKGIFEKSMSLYFEALRIAEKLKDEKRIAKAYGGIAIIYTINNKLELARSYYDKCIQLYKKQNNLARLASTYNNVGLSYMHEKKEDMALKYFHLSLKYNEETGDDIGVATANENIGLIYSERKLYERAFGNYQRSLGIWRKHNDQNSEAITLSYMGMNYMRQGKNKQGIDTCLKALKLAEKVGAIATQRDLYEYISLGYENLTNSDRAFFYYKQQKRFADSVKNEEKDKQMTELQLNYSFEKRQLQDSLRFQVERERVKAEVAQKQKALTLEKRIRYSLTVVVLLLIGLSIVIWKGYKDKQRINQVIEIQKTTLEVKNKAITDSINYAQNLQKAILPGKKIIQEHFPDSFVLFKPKDIVAGDFYWMELAQNRTSPENSLQRQSRQLPAAECQLIAVADCTGHGVPGAMVSVVCSNALNRAVKEFHITDPGKILDKVRELVLETFEKSEKEVKDGMDISLCAIIRTPSTELSTIYWAGANNPLWYCENNVLKEIKGNKQPVGKTDNPKPFNTHQLELKKDSVLYMFSDGYADQFGGPKGKKFKYRQLLELISGNSSRPMKEQKEILQKTFENWRGDLEQVDDVCIIGLRL